MSGPSRDWDKEMAAIDRAIAKQTSGAPPAPIDPGGRLAGAPAATASRPPVSRRTVALTWLSVFIALALAVVLPVWPYDKSCGLPLVFFLGATALTILAGMLAAVSSWAARRGIAHMVSLLVLGWGVAVAAGQILPRVGYAKQTSTWLCTTTPEPAPAPAGPTSR